mgnify:CR=1 FL=1
MDDEDFGDDYVAARKIVVDCATNKRRDAENKKTGRRSNTMDVGNVDEENYRHEFGQGLEGQEEMAKFLKMVGSLVLQH